MLLPAYLRGANAVVAGFDITSRETYEECDRRIKIARDASPGATVVAVGNKVDLAEERQVSKKEAQAHFASMGIAYMETSAKTGEGVDELFHALVKECSAPNENV